MNVFEAFRHAMHDKRVEPQKRIKGDRTPQWIVHRFPVKGGISMREAWVRDLAETNPLFKILMCYK